MSVLETPRVLFKGQIGWDPITTNNYDQFYNESTDESVFQNVSDKVKAFRQTAIGAVTANGNWNPHGTHRVNFFDASVSAVDCGKGVVTDDKFVSSAANLNAMLVDLEPYGAFSSQLFFDTMKFGVDGGYRILCQRCTRITARYINFARNPANNMIAGVASVVWQTSFAKTDGLRIDAFDSRALMALRDALAADDVLGLTVRFNSYCTVYFDDATLSNGSPRAKQLSTLLAQELQGGGFQPNPARSVMVGVIGLWRKDEPIHEPGDRTLLSAAGTVGSAYTRLSHDSLTIDLANSIPESSRDLTKTNLGTLSIVATDAQGGADVSLGTLDYAHYNREAYDASSGIVTLPLTPAQAQAAATRDIAVRDGNENVLLAESAVRMIPRTPNVYLDQGATLTAKFQAYRRGVPVREQLTASVYTMSSDGGSISSTASLQTDANGVLSFPIEGSTGGVVAYVATLSAAPPPSQGINPQTDAYMYVRTLPANSDIAALPPTWDNVYQRVLADWNAMAPCMDNWLLLNDPTQIKRFAAIIKRLTDPANFESYFFMPVTRDMSAGKRALLYRFLDAPGNGLPAGQPSAAQPQNTADLSRAMRRPKVV